jgi:4-methylaminobutanoate oxidase (formaldehyde-forming)
MIEGGATPVNQEWVDAGEWTVEIDDRRFPATASVKPMYDPTNARIRA